MKYPKILTLIRHAESEYNIYNSIKMASPLYKSFLLAYEKDPDSSESFQLATKVKENIFFNYSDFNTPLTTMADIQIKTMTTKLKEIIPLPDVIFVSPFTRTMDTLTKMSQSWPELTNVKTIHEPRIIEQNYGLASQYNDWRLYNVFHPDQRDLYLKLGKYQYRYPGGENIPDVKVRLQSWVDDNFHNFGSQNILVITHHLAILALRTIIEKLDEKMFLTLDKNAKPINAGVTIYHNYVLDKYNVKMS